MVHLSPATVSCAALATGVAIMPAARAATIPVVSAKTRIFMGTPLWCRSRPWVGLYSTLAHGGAGRNTRSPVSPECGVNHGASRRGDRCDVVPRLSPDPGPGSLRTPTGHAQWSRVSRSPQEQLGRPLVEEGE